MTTATPIASWLQTLPRSPLNFGYAVNDGKMVQTATRWRTKVALIGASMLGDDPPPLDDQTWEVWGCNSLWRKHLDKKGQFRADRWFEMHPMSAQTEQELLDIADCPVPLYVLEEQPHLPHAVVYPFDLIEERFSERHYFTVTFAYQIALALSEGFKEIGLFGVELYQGSTRERRVEWPCLTYWMGLARGLGVTLTLPNYSKLLWHEHLYGYDYDEDVAQSKIDDRDFALNWMREQHKEKHRKKAVR